MISLLLVVFLLNVVIHLVNTLGAATINELLWILYSKLPTPTSKDAQKAQSLKKEALRLKRELNGTSAQDEFSKWARLRRAHDKASAEYEKSASSIKATRSTFDRVANALRWLSTNGARYLLQFWFSKQPVFWLPRGWVPGYVEWVLAFPRAPTGGVSVHVWGIACVSVIGMVGEGVGALWALYQRQREEKVLGQKEKERQREVPMAFESGRDQKKEL